MKRLSRMPSATRSVKSTSVGMPMGAPGRAAAAATGWVAGGQRTSARRAELGDGVGRARWVRVRVRVSVPALVVRSFETELLNLSASVPVASRTSRESSEHGSAGKWRSRLIEITLACSSLVCGTSRSIVSTCMEVEEAEAEAGAEVGVEMEARVEEAEAEAEAEAVWRPPACTGRARARPPRGQRRS